MDKQENCTRRLLKRKGASLTYGVGRPLILATRIYATGAAKSREAQRHESLDDPCPRPPQSDSEAHALCAL